MNHTEKELLVNRGNTTMDLTTGTATVAVAADRYGADHRRKESPSFLRKQEPSFLRKQESKGNGHPTRKTDKKWKRQRKPVIPAQARTVIPAKAGTVIPAKAGIQKIELIEKSNPEWAGLYGELV